MCQVPLDCDEHGLIHPKWSSLLMSTLGQANIPQRWLRRAQSRKPMRLQAARCLPARHAHIRAHDRQRSSSHSRYRTAFGSPPPSLHPQPWRRSTSIGSWAVGSKSHDCRTWRRTGSGSRAWTSPHPMRSGQTAQSAFRRSPTMPMRACGAPR